MIGTTIAMLVGSFSGALLAAWAIEVKEDLRHRLEERRAKKAALHFHNGGRVDISAEDGSVAAQHIGSVSMPTATVTDLSSRMHGMGWRYKDQKDEDRGV
ncbi:hypothetical protein [Nocardia sp. NPDC057440]|uniref:hypothetical protein n=1 Tax=Nocardia sp. NPDC057440 TaxID=3346134 RepID=UPI00366ED82B